MNKKKEISIATIIVIIMVLFIGHNVFGKSYFSGERLKKACYEYIQTIVGEDALISLPPSIPDQSFEEQGIIAKFNWNTQAKKGNSFIALEFYNNEKIIKRIEIPVRIQIFDIVPVAKKTITRGAIIRDEDISLEKREITNYKENEIIDYSEIIGKKAKHNIKEGTVLCNYMIEEEPIIERGNKVNIIVQSGGVRIRTNGEALQNGRIGEKIRIKREGTQTILQGRVAKDGSVIISND